jgi:predicted ribonuclease YlaK
MAITLFVDTNVFLQCHDLKDLSPSAWDEVTGESEIFVVVARTVIREIDNLKNDGKERRAKRARRVYSFLSQLALKDGSPQEVIRESSPRLILSIAPPAQQRTSLGQQNRPKPVAKSSKNRQNRIFRARF